MRWAAAPAVVLAVVLAAPTAASALWSATASGSAQAPAGTLAPPTSVSVSWNPTVRVEWTASSSPFTAGYRVSRSVATSGPWTEFADVPAATTAVNDTPGAGTWYYQVHAYRDAWTSPGSPVVARTDQTYVVTGQTATTGTTCPALTPTYSMRQGFVPSGSGVSSVFGANSARLCTDTFTDGQLLPPGTTTITAHVANTSNSKTCGITVTVSKSAAVSLGTASFNVLPGTSAASPQTWAVTTTGVSFVAGDRINVRLTPDSNANCGSTSLHVGGSGTQTKVKLPG